MSFASRVLRKLRRAQLRLRSETSSGRQRLFGEYFRENYWEDDESVSGPGSNATATAALREALPAALEQLGVRVLLDVPCGDAKWIRSVDYSFERYIGADIVPELIEQLQKSAAPHETFMVLDAIEGDLPEADAILTRDFFIHLSLKHISAVLDNVRASGARYLMASTYRTQTNTRDVPTGGFRLVNLEAAPFSLGEPLMVVDDHYPKYPDKVLGVWDLSKT